MGDDALMLWMHGVTENKMAYRSGHLIPLLITCKENHKQFDRIKLFACGNGAFLYEEKAALASEEWIVQIVMSLICHKCNKPLPRSIAWSLRLYDCAIRFNLVYRTSNNCEGNTTHTQISEAQVLKHCSNHFAVTPLRAADVQILITHCWAPSLCRPNLATPFFVF